MWTDDEIKGKILHKLTRLGKFKHSHTSIDKSINVEKREKIIDYIDKFLEKE
ncbi:MAG: hypothetical protein ISS82_05135 [Nanoarchaeota archaeon]|nr:hypothetical protein [Nanoarchaeota archaeon]